MIEKAGVTTDGEKPFIDTLRELMNGFQSPFVPGLPRFTGGAVGYLGYDTAAWFEPTATRAGDAPLDRDDAGFMLFDTVLAFDHVQHRILLIANARISGDEDLKSLYQFACAKIEFLERELERALSLKRPAAATPSISSRTCRSRPTSRSSSAPRNTSPPATSTRSCCRSASKPRSASTRSRSIAPCATSIRRRTCSSSAWAIARSSDRRPRCWCASKAATRSRIRSPARGRAASRKKRTCASARS